MDIQEKLVEAGRSVNKYLWIIFISIMILSSYLIQRTVQFSEQEDGFLGAQAQHQSQVQFQGGTLFKLDFTYATMNIAWIWLLAVLLFSATLTLKKRQVIFSKLSSDAQLSDVTSSLFPLDFFSTDFRQLFNKTMWIMYVLVGVVCCLQIFPVAFHFFIDERFIEGSLITIGTLYCIYAFICFHKQKRKLT